MKLRGCHCEEVDRRIARGDSEIFGDWSHGVQAFVLLIDHDGRRGKEVQHLLPADIGKRRQLGYLLLKARPLRCSGILSTIQGEHHIAGPAPTNMAIDTIRFRNRLKATLYLTDR